MIHKSELKGKFVEYLDRDGKLRTNKVLRVSGSFLTVVDASKWKRRVHIDKVNCQIYRGHIRVEIDKSRRRKK